MVKPKQYALIAGLPLVVHTLIAFNALNWFGHGVVVVAPDDEEMNQTFQRFPQDRFHISNTGGQTRAQSVLAGLKALKLKGVKDHDWVLVHDAARCLITSDLIEKLVLSCEDDEVGGLLALPLPDTLKNGSNGRVASTIERQGKWLAQTPQMFRMKMLEDALLAAGDGFTDESSAIESLGYHPKLIEGAAYNFKVTFPEDAAMAEALLLARLNFKAQS